MTNTEKQIFRLISDNPMISQEELAYQVNITRSSASVHVSNLIKKGYIAGRGYVISEFEKVVLVGSAMIDLYGKSNAPLLPDESNPGSMSTHVGGVSRNIAENLSRLGVQTSLITSVCDDPFGTTLKDSCKEVGIDISHSYFPTGVSQTTYLAILDNDGEMKLALSDTKALQMLSIDHLEKKGSIIESGEVIIMDTSLSKEVLDYMAETYKDKRILIDPVSIGMAKKIKDTFGKFHTLKCNKNEAEYLSDMKITDSESVKAVGKFFMDSGVKQVYITLGKDGVYYKSDSEEGFTDTIDVEVQNVTGAGDAFSAGVAYCLMSNSTLEYTAKFSTCMSALALQSPYAVSEEISLHKVTDLLKLKWKRR